MKVLQYIYVVLIGLVISYVAMGGLPLQDLQGITNC